MFNSKAKFYSRKIKSVNTDEYGEPIVTYTAASPTHIKMFISLSNEITTSSQDMRIQQCSHIGLTKATVTVGDLIDDKYEVQFINNAGREKIVYMKEIESDGSFS